jgi:thiol:disulfide interchange protein
MFHLKQIYWHIFCILFLNLKNSMNTTRMKNLRRWIGLGAILLLSAGPAVAQVQFFHGTWDEALAKAKKENKPLLVDFWATWCGPCRLMNTSTFQDKQVGAFTSDHFIAYKVDVDQERALASKYNIQAMPTFVFIDAKGKELHRVMGYHKADKWLAALKNANATIGGSPQSNAGR